LTATTDSDPALTPALRAIADAQPEFLCLINNAATAGPVGTIGSLGSEALTSSMAVNLVAPVAVANLFCRVFVTQMRGQTRAQIQRIINVSSGAADSPLPGGGPYSIAKAGLEMLTRQLAAEHDAATFRAITVRPGVIDTDLQPFMRSQTRETLPGIDLLAGFHRQHRVVLVEMAIERHRESRLESVADTLSGLERDAFLGRGVRRELETEHSLGRLQPAGSGGAAGRHGDPERHARNCAKSDTHLIVRSLAAPARDPPVFHQECPALMVPPAAGDLDVTAGITLAGEASAPHQRDRTSVRRLDVDLDSMQPQGAKSYA